MFHNIEVGDQVRLRHGPRRMRYEDPDPATVQAERIEGDQVIKPPKVFKIWKVASIQKWKNRVFLEGLEVCFVFVFVLGLLGSGDELTCWLWSARSNEHSSFGPVRTTLAGHTTLHKDPKGLDLCRLREPAAPDPDRNFHPAGERTRCHPRHGRRTERGKESDDPRSS